jgi:hypothetical protein
MKDLRVVLRADFKNKSRKRYVIQDYSDNRKQLGKSFKYKTDALKVAKELWSINVLNPNEDLNKSSSNITIKLLQEQVLDLKKKLNKNNIHDTKLSENMEIVN